MARRLANLKMGPIARITHGSTNSPEYHAWGGMRQRCLNPKNRRWKDYGGRGITICARWASFENFLSDMGFKPKGTSLDRVNNDGNYEPSNCRWATPKEQRTNTRTFTLIEYEGITQSIEGWAAETGIKPHTLACRLRRGWSVEDAFHWPSNHKSKHRRRLKDK
jgi:hypothetical protein